MSFGTFKDGMPVTQADIDRWAVEAETGYDIDELIAQGAEIRRGAGRPPAEFPRNSRLQVRIDEPTRLALAERLQVTKETPSQYLSRLLEQDLMRGKG